jgi:myo-inositol-1(or 4)-monophosphatase
MLKTAINAAKEAGEIIIESMKNKKIIDYKSAVNILTDTDLKSEKKILSIIKEKFPAHSFYTEESSNNKITQDDLWVIDPLDGTTNFFHTFPHFCISIAHLYRGKVDLGVIYDPFKKELFHAEIGKGSFLNDKKIAVSNTEKLSDSLLITGFAYERGEILKRNLILIEKFFDTGIQGIRRTGSAALDLCYVACGRADGYWEFAIKPWDHAAGSLIITEAGGKITKINGGNYEVFKNDVIASNSKIHEQMLKILSDTK